MSSASAGVMPKATASNRSVPPMKPPKRARSTEAPPRGASRSHAEKGTIWMASWLPAADVAAEPAVRLAIWTYKCSRILSVSVFTAAIRAFSVVTNPKQNSEAKRCSR